MDKPNYEIFKALLDLKGVKASDVGRATQIDSATFSNWKLGRYAPKSNKIQAIAEYFEIAPWAFYGDVSDLHSYKSPLFDVAAGQGRVNEQYPCEYVDEKEDGEYSYAKVHGESMTPILMPGDIVKIHHQTETKPDDFTVVQINGDESAVKYVEIVEDGVWLRAENKEVFPDRFYTIQEVMTLPVRIIGKAVEVRRTL